MGKPKKNLNEKTDIRTILGKKIRYIGLFGATFTCSCGRTIKRGMVSEYSDQLYCSEDCIHAKQRLSGVNI